MDEVGVVVVSVEELGEGLGVGCALFGWEVELLGVS